MEFSRSKKESILSRITEIIKANLSNEYFGVSELVREMGMSRSNLHRKVKAETGKSISLFIRHLRLEEACRLLRQTSLTASEVAFKCGFHSVSYFARCFHDEYGYPPGQAARIEEEEHDTDNNRVRRTDPGRRKRKLFIFLISAISVIIVACIIFIIVHPSFTSSKPLEKSIAVLPFINDSPEKTDTYFIDGTMEAILDNLCKIKDLRVIPRTSVIQYREHPKPASEIARELKVSYILEGSGQKYGDSIRLTLQLIDADHEKHIWSQKYDREISKIENLFSLQSEIALQVAEKIEATVTPDEKRRIQKIPTKSPTAFDFYQRAIDEHFRVWAFRDYSSLLRAKKFYRLALDNDSTLGLAWIGLAFVYWDEHFQDSYLAENFMDSALILANIGLSFDDQISGGYNMRGLHSSYTSHGQISGALKSYEKAIEVNPNDWVTYRELGKLYDYSDLVKSIENLHKSASLNPRLHLPRILRELGWHYLWAGFVEEAEYFVKEAFVLDEDTLAYCYNLGYMEYCLGNFDKAFKLGEQGYKVNPKNQRIRELLADSYRMTGRYEEALKYCQNWVARFGLLVEFRPNYPLAWLGQIYWENGYREEADQYFKEHISRSTRAIEYGRPHLNWYLSLASVYAFTGEKNKAFENLRTFYQKAKVISLPGLNYLKNEPMFDNIRDEPEFQELLKEFEAKYEAEHERIRKWLDEQDRL